MATSFLLEEMGANCANDVLRHFVGKAIAVGVHRCVYECNANKSYVVKVHRDDCCLDNMIEAWVWEYAQSEKRGELRKWLAPVISISPHGQSLLMARTERLTDRQLKMLPRRVPDFFTDLKPQNWGMLDGHLVCHDYANNTLPFAIPAFTCRMKKVEWFGVEDYLKP